MTVTNDEPRNVLETGRLHRLMVFFQKAEELPAPGIVVVQLFAAALVAVLWRLRGAPVQISLAAAVALILTSVADVLFLRWLPRQRISFGPWKAQTVVLLTPRALAGVALTLLGSILNWPVVFVALGLAQLSGSLLLWWGAAVETRRLTLTYLDVPVSCMPPRAKPVRLLHISDIHLERFTDREKNLLSLVRRAKPDLIVITGDYLNLSYNRDKVSQQQVAQMLAQLEAPYGVYATLGSPPVDVRSEIVPVLEALPLRLLRDEWTTVEFEGGATIVLLGVDCTHHLHQDAARLDGVATTAPISAPRVLLYHSPELMPRAVERNIDLYLCGHTHGGQIRLPLIGPILTSSQLGRRYVMGHYHQGRTNLYVSRGVGLEGLSAPRVRLLAAPEITLVTIHPENCER